MDGQTTAAVHVYLPGEEQFCYFALCIAMIVVKDSGVVFFVALSTVTLSKHKFSLTDYSVYLPFLIALLTTHRIHIRGAGLIGDNPTVIITISVSHFYDYCRHSLICDSKYVGWSAV